MKSNSGSNYPNQHGNHLSQGSGFPVEYAGQPPITNPVGNYYPTNPPPAYGSAVGFKDTAYGYPYKTQNEAQQSSIERKSLVESNSMEKPNSYWLTQCPGQQCSLPNLQSVATNQTSQENLSCPGMACLQSNGCPNVTIRNSQYPQVQAPYRASVPLPFVPSEELQCDYSQQLAQKNVRQFPTSLHLALLQDFASDGVPLSSTQKRLAEYLEPNLIPAKKKFMDSDQSAMPYSTQLNGDQNVLHIQGSCYLTVTKDTKNPQDTYTARPSVKVVDVMKDLRPAYVDILRDINRSVFNMEDEGSRTYIREKQLSHIEAGYIVNNVVNLTLKYMPDVQPVVLNMYKKQLLCFPDAVCLKLLKLVNNQSEKLFLEGYIKHKSQICSLVNDSCALDCKKNQGSSSQLHMTDLSLKQTPSNAGNATADSASTNNQCVFNSGNVNHSWPIFTAVPKHSKQTFSPTLSNNSSPVPRHFSPVTHHCLPAYSHSVPPLNSFSKAPSSFSCNITDPSSSDSPCTFLSESEFRDQPCGPDNKNLPVTENFIPPPVFENITPPPTTRHHQETPNYDQLHLNTIAVNNNYQMQAAHSGALQNGLVTPKNVHGKANLISPSVSYHQTPLNYDTLHLNPTVGNYNYQKQDACLNGQYHPRLCNILRQPDVSYQPISSHPQNANPMGDVNFQQHAASLMKLPETISPQQSSFLPKPDTIKQQIKQNLVQKAYNNALPVKQPPVVPSMTYSEPKSPKADNPVIPKSKGLKYSLQKNPDCFKATGSMESEKCGHISFKVQPLNGECRKETQEPKAISDMSCFIVKPDHLEVNRQTQNTSQGDALSQMSLPVIDECITIEDSDDPDVIILDDQTGPKSSSGSSNPDRAVPNTVNRIPVSSSRPVSHSSDSNSLHSESPQAQEGRVYNLKTNTNEGNIAQSEDVSTHPGENSVHNSGVSVGGTTCAVFTIDGDESEMAPQEFSMDLLDMLVNCG